MAATTERPGANRFALDLRPLYGKKEIIRKSLATSDRREAVSRLRYEVFKLDSDFADKRRAAEASKPKTPFSKQLREIGERETHDLVFRWFIGQEKMSDEWWANAGIGLR